MISGTTRPPARWNAEKRAATLGAYPPGSCCGASSGEGRSARSRGEQYDESSRDRPSRIAFSLRLDVQSSSQVLQRDGCLCHRTPASPC